MELTVIISAQKQREFEIKEKSYHKQISMFYFKK